jgi:hypothetical protein
MNLRTIAAASNPLPNLPPGGKEQLFPLGGNGKGGSWSS